MTFGSNDDNNAVCIDGKNYRRFRVKNINLKFFVVVVLFALLFSGCVSTQVGAGLVPDNGNAVVTVKRSSAYSGSLVGFNIHIDNQKVGAVANGGETKTLVKNGTHNIYIEVLG